MSAVVARVRAIASLVVATTGIALAAACPADPRRDGAAAPIARIDDVAITQGRFLAVLAQKGVAREADRAARKSVAEALLQQMIDEELLVAAARKAGITVDDAAVEREARVRADGYPPGQFARVLTAEQLTLEAFRDSVRKRLLQDAFLRARLAQTAPVTTDEVQAVYDRDYAGKTHPEQVRARQILLRTEEEARHVVEEARSKPATFDALARRYSIGPEAAQGGDLGWFARGELPDVFDTCHALDVGTISDAVSSDYGFHIFQVLDRRAEAAEPLDAVRDRIVEELTRERQSHALDELIASLRLQAKIETPPVAMTRVLSLLPDAPVTPAIKLSEEGQGRALDSHDDGADPLPAVPHPDSP